MAKTPRALITGVTGQDGSYLAEFLLGQGYEVIGMLRRSSTVNFERIRHIPAAAIRPGAIIDGPVLIEAGPTLNIDNMEAMAVHEDSRGATVITILSDDNYNPLERTLLLQFRLDQK